MASEKYTPGVCNIGPVEMKQRKRSGYISLAITVILWIIFLAIHATPGAYFLLIIPAAAAASGFLQSAMHFCARFGMRGLFNVSDEMGKTETVEQAEFHMKDRQKAREIIIYALIIGILVGLSAYLLVA